MGVTKDFIIPEKRFEDLFAMLPPLRNSNDIEFQPNFEIGSQEDLLIFLKTVNDNDYPIIWLETPYLEDHQRTHVLLENVSLILSVNSGENERNESRLDTSFRDILLKLANNIKFLFNRSNIIYTDDTYRIRKFFRYSINGENGVTAVWDAVKITFSCTINDKCIKTITFPNE